MLPAFPPFLLSLTFLMSPGGIERVPASPSEACIGENCLKTFIFRKNSDTG
jgi:hypothetical protein